MINELQNKQVQVTTTSSTVLGEFKNFDGSFVVVQTTTGLTYFALTNIVEIKEQYSPTQPEEYDEDDEIVYA
ncbi:hypothetical protein CIG75_19055 [Tumebacillus algifaecis]|uniref:DUF2642 domain-containing protein n=1 Tax=Tumebacillus algifaecis TaxID=1214604 RepID=A0A223D5U0_9BACL|nr:hypothetical protein [Tumebacillus algifaecis]ASS76833.1 hypothetical protein CIG75_19055 [Tumebacillus algifaecis]